MTTPITQGSVGVNVSRLPACKGTNCGSTDGRSHSAECAAEHDAAAALPYSIFYTQTGEDVEPVTKKEWLAIVAIVAITFAVLILMGGA